MWIDFQFAFILHYFRNMTLFYADTGSAHGNEDTVAVGLRKFSAG